jgi:hypothetical protein
MARGDHAGAEAAWRQSLDALERVHEGPHPDIAYTWGMLAWSHYMRDDFKGALEHVERGLAQREALPDGDLAMINWLAPLRSLVELELDRPAGLAELQRTDACDDLAGISSLQQRFCLARRLLETDPPARCKPSAVPAADADSLEALPERWRVVHRLLQYRCTGGRAPRAADFVDFRPPEWLSSRLSRSTRAPDEGRVAGPE